MSLVVCFLFPPIFFFFVIELLLNNTWRPQLAVTGADGFPAIKSAGNVLRPYTAVKLSIRLPPTADAMKATAAVKQLLEKVRVSPPPLHPASLSPTSNYPPLRSQTNKRAGERSSN
jgi:hypothetical protein